MTYKTITLNPPKPYTRVKIKPVVRFSDKKKDYKRKPKHRVKGNDHD